MKVYFEDNEKMGEIKNALIDEDGVTIIVSTEDDKRYKVKLNDDDAKLLIHMIHMKSIKDYVVNDISGIIIKTNDVEEIPVRGKRRESGIIDEDYSSYWNNSKVPYKAEQLRLSTIRQKDIVNRDFPLEVNVDLTPYKYARVVIKCRAYNAKLNDIDVTLKVNRESNKYYVLPKGFIADISAMLVSGQENKITISTDNKEPFILEVDIDVEGIN